MAIFVHTHNMNEIPAGVNVVMSGDFRALPIGARERFFTKPALGMVDCRKCDAQYICEYEDKEFSCMKNKYIFKKTRYYNYQDIENMLSEDRFQSDIISTQLTYSGVIIYSLQDMPKYNSSLTVQLDDYFNGRPSSILDFVTGDFNKIDVAIRDEDLEAQTSYSDQDVYLIETTFARLSKG